ncbi:probable cationic amino acid transporter [Teleopsis dalmanni]|uniref:probable cationic amino acid transporter n=1 Tax=Teleopsis dalmanni TaxID=139649 RepID=UPI0018CC8634|nr:probable cationic amino acid transporter [Teleopsis dalmanni]
MGSGGKVGKTPHTMNNQQFAPYQRRTANSAHRGRSPAKFSSTQSIESRPKRQRGANTSTPVDRRYSPHAAARIRARRLRQQIEHFETLASVMRAQMEVLAGLVERLHPTAASQEQVGVRAAESRSRPTSRRPRRQPSLSPVEARKDGSLPYDHINSGAALVQMWSYVAAPKCRVIVAIGATAGLSVAMFGSMFPMPRVIYAMAQDGLILKQLSHLWQRTNVPGLATICSGIAAAVVALTVRLEILVEMMSIGTLLAYTLVSTCVLVLRYQPHSTSLVELLPAQLRIPLTPGAASNPNATTAEVLHTNKLTIKRVTRGISDSDDSFIDDSPEGYLGRDDQFLVSDRSENKFYGSVHGAPPGPTGQATAFDTMGFNFLTRKLSEYTYLCPGFFPWINPGQATADSGMYVTKLVGIMFSLIFLLDLFAAIGWSGGLAATFYFLIIIGIFVILLIISRQPQNRYALAFLTPGLPFIPAIAITVNIYLIFKLSILTLVRFTFWMTLGFIMYFYYGITHSTLEQTTDEIELHIDKDYSKNLEEKAVWDEQSYISQSTEPVWVGKEAKHSTSKCLIQIQLHVTFNP